MALRHVHGSWWIDVGWKRKRYRLRSPDNTEDGARTYEDTIRRQLARGRRVRLPFELRLLEERNREKTFGEFAEEWFTTYVETNLRPSTRVGYRTSLDVHLLPAFGRRRLSEVTAFAIEEFKARKVRNGHHPKSINNWLCVLRSSLTTAMDWGRLERLPRIRRLKAPPPSFDYLSHEESERLLEASKGTPWSLMIRAALRTGMRLGELRALRWNDVDLGRGQVMVCRAFSVDVECSPKNNRTRVIPLTEDLMVELATFPRRGRLVFATREQKPHETNAAGSGLRRVCGKAGLREVGWHVLRHTFATHLRMAGRSLDEIQYLLGHSTIAMTERYAHLAPSTLRKSLRVLELPASGFRPRVSPLAPHDPTSSQCLMHVS